jgi:hypothetical protein
VNTPFRPIDDTEKTSEHRQPDTRTTCADRIEETSIQSAIEAQAQRGAG